MEILLWLLPAVLATALAMGWVAWVGRERTVGADRSDAAQARFAKAIMKPLPEVAARRPAPRERSTGVAIRRDSNA